MFNFLLQDDSVAMKGGKSAGARKRTSSKSGSKSPARKRTKSGSKSPAKKKGAKAGRASSKSPARKRTKSGSKSASKRKGAKVRLKIRISGLNL